MFVVVFFTSSTRANGPKQNINSVSKHQTDRQRHRETERNRDRQRDREKQRQAETGTDRQTDRHVDRDGQRERAQNPELYYPRIKILGSCLFLQSVPASLHA